MNRLTWIWLIVLCFLLTGCASTSSTSVVNTDGSWSRTVKFSVRDMPSFGGENNEKPPEVFAIPTSADWNKSEQTKNEEKITTLKRAFKAGEGPITDIVVKEKGETKYKNYVVIRKLDGNRIEYYEKVVMVGGKPARTEEETNNFIKDMKAALPPGKATDEELKTMSEKTEIALTRLLFGPDDHLFGSMLTNIDGTVRRIRAKVGPIEDRVLLEVLGSKLTAEEREATVKKLLAKFDDSTSLLDKQKPSPAESSGGNSSFIGMSVAVKLPGKVIESNGEIDPYTGEVFWDFLSNSAEPGTLELRAICQLP